MPETDVLNAFALEFDQTFFYSYFLQIILVTYMYFTVGHGKYWKVLFYGSILGFFGALMEHIFQAYQSTLPEEEKYTTNVSILLFFAEIGWITTEFSVPLLNLIKLNSLTNVKLIKAINATTGVLFCGFTFFRIEIGYFRFTEHRVGCTDCNAFHSQAFGVMAATDIILSIMIFYRINKTTREYKIKKNNENISILATFRKSSVFSLLIVDVISVFLSLTYIFNSTKDYAKPFHALKSNFLLILAVDAFIFKFNANTGATSYRSYNSQSNINKSTNDNASIGACSSYYKPTTRNMVTSLIVKPNNYVSANNNSSNNIANYNLASSQPLLNNNNIKYNNDTEIDFEPPKPIYNMKNENGYTNPYNHDSADNINHLYRNQTQNNNMNINNIYNN